MTGLDKIIQEIRAEGEKDAAAIRAAGKADADEILARAKVQYEEESRLLGEESQKAVVDIRQASDSAVALRRRQRTLETKQALLAETLDKALETLYALSDEAYFDLLVRLAAKNAAPGKGEILLNAKDRARLPKDFEQRVQEALPQGRELTLSAQTRVLDGGFVLKYGDIEVNNSFKAIFDASADEMADSIRAVLFGQMGA